MPSFLGSVATQGTMLTLTGRPGDWAKRTDLGTAWMVTAANSNLIGSWTEIAAAPLLSASAVLDFGSIAAGGVAELTVVVSGSAAGDAVLLGPPAGLEAGLVATARVSATDTVTVRLHNSTAGAIDPASGTWKVRTVR